MKTTYSLLVTDLELNVLQVAVDDIISDLEDILNDDPGEIGLRLAAAKALKERLTTPSDPVADLVDAVRSALDAYDSRGYGIQEEAEALDSALAPFADVPDVEDMKNVLNWAIRTAKEILPPPQGVPCDCGSGNAYWDGPDHSRRYACETCHERGRSSFVVESLSGILGNCLLGEGATTDAAWIDAFGPHPWSQSTKAAAKKAWVREVSPAELEELHAESATR